MSDIPVPDRENGITPATRVVRKLDPEMGLLFVKALAAFGSGIMVATSGAVMLLTDPHPGIRALTPAGMVIAGGLFAKLGANVARAVADDGDRVVVPQTVEPKPLGDLTSIATAPNLSGNTLG